MPSPLRSASFAGLLSVGLLASALCPQAANAADAAEKAAPPPARATTDYILQPGDLLHVEVFKQEDLKRDRRITQEYLIDLPLIGQINLRDKTLSEATKLIRDLYDKDYLVNPNVTVTVVEYVKRYVNVNGEVKSPGAIEFPPEQGMTLIEAITRAGSFTRIGKQKKVTLTRRVDGKPETKIINVEDIMSGKEKDVPLMKDDVINVPENLF